jgi:LCP family protein required for cell wall assembly
VSDATAKHRAADRPRHRVLRVLGHVVLVLSLAMGLFVAYTYRTLNDNLTVLDANNLFDRPDKEDVEGRDPLNILVMGSDTRDGEGNDIDGMAGGGQRSDTTILLHVSGDRKSAYGVSLPRDAMVQRPDCKDADGDLHEGSGEELVMWNEAFSVGGPLCTVQQTEQLTGVRIDHFVVVDFRGFKDMVDAIDGVEICVPETVDDREHGIYLEAGRRVVEGQEALNYVRVRSGISDNGDIGRMKRQQVFLAAMAKKASSMETLANPARLTGFLRAVTRSLTLDEGLGTVNKLYKLSQEFGDIEPGDIRFLTVPWEWWPEDPNRLVWTDRADDLWELMREDQPLSRRLSNQAVSAAGDSGEEGEEPSGEEGEEPTDEVTDESTEEPGDEVSEDPDDEPTDEETRSPEEIAAENGLCA